MSRVLVQKYPKVRALISMAISVWLLIG